MKTMDLISAKNHIEVYVIQTLNSFGDQKLEFIKENLDGSKEKFYYISEEGQWIQWEKEELLMWYKSISTRSIK